MKDRLKPQLPGNSRAMKGSVTEHHLAGLRPSVVEMQIVVHCETDSAKYLMCRESHPAIFPEHAL